MSHAVRLWVRAPHLTAAGIALITATLALWLFFDGLHLERRLAHSAAPQMLDVKDQGLTLQAEAFRDSDLLPIYGSSEFRNDSPYSGRVFFSHYPTGFGLFVVGKAGSKCLITTQRLASLGSVVRGKKVVFILSPTWFMADKESPDSYAGNFSAVQASRFIFESPISHALKKDVAREMLKYPRTLVDHPLLHLALEQLGRKPHSLEERLVLSLGKSEDFFEVLLDRIKTPFALAEDDLSDIDLESAPAHHAKTTPNWDTLVQRAAKRSSPTKWETKTDIAAPKLEEKLHGRANRSFTALLDSSDEWLHLQLLMRTIRELGVKPLFISLPINASAFEMTGIKPSELDYYYARLRNEVSDFHYPLVTFQDEQNDPYFFGDSLGHPSAMGWMILNHTINRFYHDKLPSSLH